MSPAEPLVEVEGAQLHQVEGGEQRLLAEGPFSVAIVGEGDGSTVRAQVGPVAWALGKHLPALKAAPTIYSFGLEHTRNVYYILILPHGTPPAALEAVEDVLASSCAFSTARQVDAAAERADALAGGRAAQEAEALAAKAAAHQGGASFSQGAGPGAGGPAPGSAAATGYAGTPAAAAAAGQLQGGAGPQAPGKLQQQPQPAQPYPQQQPQPQQPPQQEQQQQPGEQAPVTAADRIASGILMGGSALAGLVKRASGAATDAVTRYKESRIAAGQPATSHARVSPALRQGLRVAAAVASGAAYVTGKLAALVGDASYALALRIAKSLPGHSDRPAAGGGAGSGELAPEERSAFKTVGAAGLTAYVHVYDALEDAVKQVLGHSAEATAEYVHYKYGPEAGAAAAESVPVAQDMLQAATNFTRLGARALISRTAKRTAKIYLKSALAGLHPDEQAAGHRVPGAPAAGTPPAAAAMPAARTPSAAAAPAARVLSAAAAPAARVPSVAAAPAARVPSAPAAGAQGAYA